MSLTTAQNTETLQRIIIGSLEANLAYTRFKAHFANGHDIVERTFVLSFIC